MAIMACRAVKQADGLLRFEGVRVKRSFINKIVDEAITFAREQNMTLPKFAYISADEWRKVDQKSWAEVFDLELGWDVTDYGSNDFYKSGTCLFTLRNGSVSNPKYPKPYAEKMMLIEDGQVLPYHFHTFKMEDILNRGGATLCIKCYWATADNKLDEKLPVEISFDGQLFTFAPGEEIRIPVGSGITLPSRMYHSIYAVGGKVMSWEVSKVNDDHTDNIYLEGCPRFSEIEEDEPMRWCLCNEYAKVRN